MKNEDYLCVYRVILILYFNALDESEKTVIIPKLKCEFQLSVK